MGVAGDALIIMVLFDSVKLLCLGVAVLSFTIIILSYLLQGMYNMATPFLLNPNFNGGGSTFGWQAISVVFYGVQWMGVFGMIGVVVSGIVLVTSKAI